MMFSLLMHICVTQPQWVKRAALTDLSECKPWQNTVSCFCDVDNVDITIICCHFFHKAISLLVLFFFKNKSKLKILWQYQGSIFNSWTEMLLPTDVLHQQYSIKDQPDGSDWQLWVLLFQILLFAGYFQVSEPDRNWSDQTGLNSINHWCAAKLTDRLQMHWITSKHDSSQDQNDLKF